MEEHERAEAEDIIRAIRDGEVDAFVVREAAEEKIYSLRGADLLYRAMIEEMKDGAVALDPTGLIVYCNAYFAQLVNAERAALVGTKIFPLAPAEGEAFFAALGEAPNRTARRELELRATDGTMVPVLAAMNRIGLGDGGDVYCLIVTDLRDQKRREQLMTEGRRKDEFLAMLAHELRNPIAPIRYAAARLGSGEPTRARLDWARDVIDRQVDQLTRLVDDLLDVARIARGTVSLDLQPIEIEVVVARAVEAVRPLVEARKQDLKVTRPAERLTVRGDMTRLAQVVSNLLNNASKYTPERGQIAIGVEAEREGERKAWVRITVTDNGVGIRSNLVPEMFNLFAQGDADRSRAQGGLGIGLTLVRSFVEMHGGTVNGASDGPGKGSTFVVRLPLVQGAARRGRAARAVQAPPAVEGVIPRKILVVDDNVDVMESLAGWLSDCGHDVRVAQTGESALAEAQGFHPDVMLIDVGLPGMDGHEAARRVRRMPELERTVLVAVTGFGQEEDRRRSRQAGFDHHWVKPLSVDRLSDLLDSLDGPGARAT
jgi:two-component system CheB/CheR fusion protein